MAAGAPTAPKMEAVGGDNDQSDAGGLNNKAATLVYGDDRSAWVSASHDNLCFQRAKSVSRRCHNMHREDAACLRSRGHCEGRSVQVNGRRV